MTTRVFHDWEFLERGPRYPIIPISVGMVRDDGAELYLINGEFPIEAFLIQSRQEEWLRHNVVPYLPVTIHSATTGVDWIEWNEDHPDYEASVFSRDIMRQKIHTFLVGDEMPYHDSELWGWYPAYDHVCLAQMFDTMSDMPDRIPKQTNDIRQFHNHLGSPGLPPNRGPAHHALADARWTAQAFYALDDIQKMMTRTTRTVGAVRDRLTSD